MTSAASQLCHAHPTQVAFVTCRKCGLPSCAYCIGEGSEDVCAACVARDEAIGAIAWERRDVGVLARFVRTIRKVLGETGAAFAAPARVGVGPALGWAATVHALAALGVVVLVSGTALVAWLAWRSVLLPGETIAYGALLAAGLCGGPIVQALLGVFAAVVAGIVFHVAAKLAGGRAPFAASLRAAAYAQTIVLVAVPLAIVALVPGVGPIVVAVVWIVQLAWHASALTAAARAHHGLDGGRALFAGWLPSLLVFAVVAGTLVLALVVRDAVEPSRSPDVYYPDPGAAPVLYVPEE